MSRLASCLVCMRLLHCIEKKSMLLKTILNISYKKVYYIRRDNCIKSYGNSFEKNVEYIARYRRDVKYLDIKLEHIFIVQIYKYKKYDNFKRERKKYEILSVIEKNWIFRFPSSGIKRLLYRIRKSIGLKEGSRDESNIADLSWPLACLAYASRGDIHMYVRTCRFATGIGCAEKSIKRRNDLRYMPTYIREPSVPPLSL